ncbi:hypothetical protein BGX34_010933 [Mortierella sp. NVP85]|nr:hypothetical protein BGX34_010933 [Mortierella sp. NVP85]
MDESVLKSLLAALDTIYNVASTNEARQQAQEYCEGLKRDPSGPLYGYFLAHKNNHQPDVVRYFGLSLIEDAVRYRWSDGALTPEIKVQIRINTMSLAAEETGREMALLVLRSLCEDVCIYDDAVAGLRKKDLRAGLMVIMSSESTLKEQYPDGVKGHKDEVTLMVGESGNQGWIARFAELLQEVLPRCQTEIREAVDEKIAVAALKAVSSTLEWALVGSIAAAPIVPLVCQSLLSPSVKVRVAGAECFDVLSIRNLAEAEREKIIWPLLDGGGIALISNAYMAYATQVLQDEAYEFVQKIVQLYSKHLAKDYKNRYDTDPVYQHFASVDFESVSDFRGYAEKTFSRAVDVIQLGVPVVPLDALMWVGNKVVEALKTDLKPATSVKDTPELQSFDGTLTLMDVTIFGLATIITDSSHPQSAQCLPALERVVGSLASFTDMFKVNSTLLFRCLDKLFRTVEYPMADLSEHTVRQLRGRAAITLVKIGRAIPNTLYPIYSEIDSAIQGLVQRNAITHGEKRTLQTFLLVIGFNSNTPLDRKAILEKAVEPLLMDLRSHELQEATSDPSKFMAFIGALELSDASKASLQAQEIDVLKGVITQRRARLSGSIESLHAFMKETIDVKDSDKLVLWTPYVGVILPSLFSTIRCQSAIGNEALWSSLSPEMSRVLALSSEEKEMMVTGKAPSSATGSAPTGTVSKLIWDLKNWLSVLRDQSYRVLAQISLLGPAFYSVPSLQDILEQSLFEYVDCLTNRQLRLLINHAVQPIVLNCPVEYRDSVMSHLLMVLFPYLDQRLQKDWKLASDEGLILDEKEDLDELDITDGIVKEMMLRDLTYYVAGFLCAVLEPPKQATENVAETQGQGQDMTGTATQKDISPLSYFILSRGEIAQSVIPLMCRIITFKDTKSCLRATNAALSVLSILVQSYPESQAIIGAFATMVLQAAMEALHDPYHQEGQDKLIRLITEVYVEIRGFDTAPKAVFQQALGADNQHLEAFELELSGATVKARKHALVRNFLQSIIGVSKSEWFKQREQGDKPVSSRTIAGKYERPSKNVMDSKEHEDIGEGLANMFDE